MTKDFNVGFFNAAMKQLKIGSKAEDFATDYANASNQIKGSSLWNQAYEEGLKQFATMDFHKGSEGKIDKEEMNIVGLYVERMNGKSIHLPDTLDTFTGNTLLEEFRAPDGQPILQSNPDIEEAHHLKPVETLTKKELEAELEMYKQMGITEEAQDAADTPAKDIPPKEMSEDKKPPQQTELPDKDTSAKQLDPELAKLKSAKLKNKSKTQSDITPEQRELETLRKEVQALRQKRNMLDKNSDVVDMHVGTFNQGNLGSCSMLSQVNGLSDEQMKRIISKKTDENGKTYYEVTFPIDNGTNRSVKVTEEELKNRKITVTEGETSRDITAFSRGDADVTLMEMAYIKRFGIDPIMNGGDLKFLNDVFTFPEEQNQHVGTTYNVTEDKLIKAMQNGEHLSIGLHHTSRLPEDFSYTAKAEASNGVSAQWEYVSRGERNQVLERLKEMLEKYGTPGEAADISKYEKMSDAELMEATYRFVSYDFWFTAQLTLSDGNSIIEDHAYSLKDYDPDKKELTLANPHNSNEDIKIPLDIATQFFDISG